MAEQTEKLAASGIDHTAWRVEVHALLVVAAVVVLKLALFWYAGSLIVFADMSQTLLSLLVAGLLLYRLRTTGTRLPWAGTIGATGDASPRSDDDIATDRPLAGDAAGSAGPNQSPLDHPTQPAKQADQGRPASEAAPQRIDPPVWRAWVDKALAMAQTRQAGYMAIGGLAWLIVLLGLLVWAMAGRRLVETSPATLLGIAHSAVVLGLLAATQVGVVGYVWAMGWHHNKPALVGAARAEGIDAAVSVGAALGLWAIYALGWLWLDSGVAVLAAAAMMWVYWRIVWDTAAGEMGSTNLKVMEAARGILHDETTRGAIQSYRQLSHRQIAGVQMIEVRVQMEGKTNLREACDAAALIRRRLQQQVALLLPHANAAQVTVHLETSGDAHVTTGAPGTGSTGSPAIAEAPSPRPQPAAPLAQAVAPAAAAAVAVATPTPAEAEAEGPGNAVVDGLPIPAGAATHNPAEADADIDIDGPQPRDTTGDVDKPIDTTSFDAAAPPGKAQLASPCANTGDVVETNQTTPEWEDKEGDGSAPPLPPTISYDADLTPANEDRTHEDGNVRGGTQQTGHE